MVYISGPRFGTVHRNDLVPRHCLHLCIRDEINLWLSGLVGIVGLVSIRHRGQIYTFTSAENVHIYNKVKELDVHGWPRWGVDRCGWVLQDLMWDGEVVFVWVASTRLLRCLEE